MKELLNFLPIGLFLICGIWIGANSLFKKRMELLVSDKKRQRYVDFLSSWSIDLKEGSGTFISAIATCVGAWFLFYIAFGLITIGIEWIFKYDFEGKWIKYFLYFISALPAVFIIRTTTSIYTYFKKINSTKKHKLKNFNNVLNDYGNKIEKKNQYFESEISKINTATQEIIINENTKNEVEKKITEFQLQIIENKKSLSDIKGLSGRILTYFYWEEWLYKKVEDKLDAEQKKKLENYYMIENIYHPDFFDMIIDYSKFSYILGKIKYIDFIWDIKRQHNDFKEFKDKEFFGTIERDFNIVVSQYKTLLNNSNQIANKS